VQAARILEDDDDAFRPVLRTRNRRYLAAADGDVGDPSLGELQALAQSTHEFGTTRWKNWLERVIDDVGKAFEDLGKWLTESPLGAVLRWAGVLVVGLIPGAQAAAPLIAAAGSLATEGAKVVQQAKAAIGNPIERARQLLDEGAPGLRQAIERTFPGEPPERIVLELGKLLPPPLALAAAAKLGRAPASLGEAVRTVGLGALDPDVRYAIVDAVRRKYMAPDQVAAEDRIRTSIPPYVTPGTRATEEMLRREGLLNAPAVSLPAYAVRTALWSPRAAAETQQSAAMRVASRLLEHPSQGGVTATELAREHATTTHDARSGMAAALEALRRVTTGEARGIGPIPLRPAPELAARIGDGDTFDALVTRFVGAPSPIRQTGAPGSRRGR
jgi:hypothetical protein